MIHVIAVQRPKAVSWPEGDKGPPDPAIRAPLAALLTSDSPGDGHLVAYDSPATSHRLNARAIGITPISMQVALFDVDGHHAADPAEWRREQAPRRASLEVIHPGAYIYDTRGGYRIVYALPYPFPIETKQDAALWSQQYQAWIAYLARAFGIIADPACKDWQRLYRVPRALRDGVRQDLPTSGDPSNLGVWDPLLVADDYVPTYERGETKGLLYRAFERKGWLIDDKGDKALVRCPWEAHHTSGTTGDGSTVIFPPRQGDILGVLHCSHGHCANRTIRDVLAACTRPIDLPEVNDLIRAWKRTKRTKAYALECIAKGIPYDTDIIFDLAKVWHDVDPYSVGALFAASHSQMKAPPDVVSAFAQAVEHRINTRIHGPEDKRGRPIIRITDPLHAQIQQCTALLPNNNAIFSRAFRLVQQIGSDEGPRIAELHADRLKYEIDTSMRFMRPPMGESDWTEIDPPNPVVGAIYNAGQWPGVRPLVGIAETPFLRPDGSLCAQPGYDAATHYYYRPSGEFLPVPERPTLADAREALWQLYEVFGDFPYRKDQPADAFVPIAALLTILARPCIPSYVPVFAFDASTMQSGKSLQTDAISIIATGYPVARTTWPATEEELDKILASYAVEGRAVISFDNLSSDRIFRGATLEKCVTSEIVSIRILGSTRTVACAWRTVVLATGNNMTIAGDMSPRVILSRLETALERPQDRTDLLHKPLIAWVREQRPRLVQAALTLLRAFFCAGAPNLSGPGSFPEWSRIIPSAIIFGGGPDVTTSRPLVEEGHDPDIAALGTVIRTIALLDKGSGLRSNDLADPSLQARDSEFRAALNHITTGKETEASAIGKALRRHKSRIIGGYKLTTESRAGIFYWRVSKP